MTAPAAPGADAPAFLTGDMAASYAEKGPRRFVPGYDASHVMARTILSDCLTDAAEILVVGAGGGIELGALAGERPGWRFVALDPVADMIASAKAHVASRVDPSRVNWVQAYVEDAPHGPFDAATAFLALHFIPDDGRRLRALREIRRRLKPGAPFLLIDGCSQMQGPEFERDLRLYVGFARRMGAREEDIARMVQVMRNGEVFPLPQDRHEALLAEAGFRDRRLFYAGLWIRGWSLCA